MKRSAVTEILYALHNDGFIKQATDTMSDTEKFDAICSELKEKLSPELLSLHQGLVECIESDWGEEADSCFAQGFKLGLRLGFECAKD